MVRGRLESEVTIALLALLLTATAIVLYHGDLLWTCLGVWGLFVFTAPMIAGRSLRFLARPLIVLFVSVPMVLVASGILFRIQTDELFNAVLLVIGMLAGFLLSVTTLLCLRTYSRVLMNRPFFVSSAVILNIATIGVYVVLQYVSDMVFEEDVLTSLDQLMVGLISMVGGALFLGVLLGYYLHTTDLDSMQVSILGEAER
jgi:hypothetical protein